LLLEHLAALVEPLAGVTLGLTGPLLGTLGDLTASLGEEVTRFAAAAWGGQERDSGAERSPKRNHPRLPLSFFSDVMVDLLLACRLHRSAEPMEEHLEAGLEPGGHPTSGRRGSVRSPPPERG